MTLPLLFILKSSRPDVIYILLLLHNRKAPDRGFTRQAEKSLTGPLHLTMDLLLNDDLPKLIMTRSAVDDYKNDNDNF